MRETARSLIRKAGGYMNESENIATIHFRSLGMEYARRGYPDFMIIKDGEIIGFVEVKPTEGKELRQHQVLFKALCDKHGIPFIKWCPDDGIEPLAALSKSTVSLIDEPATV